MNPHTLVQAYQFIWVSNDHWLHWHGRYERPCRGEKGKEINIILNMLIV